MVEALRLEVDAISAPTLSNHILASKLCIFSMHTNQQMKEHLLIDMDVNKSYTISWFIAYAEGR